MQLAQKNRYRHISVVRSSPVRSDDLPKRWRCRVNQKSHAATIFYGSGSVVAHHRRSVHGRLVGDPAGRERAGAHWLLASRQRDPKVCRARLDPARYRGRSGNSQFQHLVDPSLPKWCRGRLDISYEPFIVVGGNNWFRWLSNRGQNIVAASFLKKQIISDLHS